LSSDIVQLTPFIAMPNGFPHGGGVEAAAKAWGCDVSDILDLSTGLHPAGQPDWLAAWLGEHADLAAHYPDVDGEPARSILAEAFGVQPEQVLITAGAQAVIEVIFHAMQWQSMGVCVPCYNEPIRCAKRAGCVVHAFESGDSLPVVDVLWWTSPNNPFGNIEAFPDGFHGVLDESYMLFSERRKLGIMPDVIRLGSLTKTFCIPGLRLGYVIADSSMIQKLKAWMPPWPSSTLALHLLPKLLPEADKRDAQVEVARERLQALLKKYDWQYYQSHAAFVLARPPAVIPDFSAKRVLVRQFPEWSQLQGWVRFGLMEKECDWQRFERALLEQK